LRRWLRDWDEADLATRFGADGFEEWVVLWLAIVIVGFLPSLKERRGKKTTTVSESERTKLSDSDVGISDYWVTPHTRALFHPPWPKGKMSILQMHIVCNLLQFMREMSEYRHQAKLNGRKSSKRSVVTLSDVEMPLIIAPLSAVEQDREAKGPRLFLGEKGHMGYVCRTPVVPEGFNIVLQTSRMRSKNSPPPRHFPMRTKKGSRVWRQNSITLSRKRKNM
jgi:hypothetical protein